MSKRLAVVVRAWMTRRLLWLWLFAYACVMTSAVLWPIAPGGSYVEGPSFMLPRNVVPYAPPRAGVETAKRYSSVLREKAAAAPNIRDLIVREPVSIRNWGALFASAPALEQVFVGDLHGTRPAFKRSVGPYREFASGIWISTAAVWHRRCFCCWRR